MDFEDLFEQCEEQDEVAEIGDSSSALDLFEQAGLNLNFLNQKSDSDCVYYASQIIKKMLGFLHPHLLQSEDAKEAFLFYNNIMSHLESGTLDFEEFRQELSQRIGGFSNNDRSYQDREILDFEEIRSKTQASPSIFRKEMEQIREDLAQYLNQGQHMDINAALNFHNLLNSPQALVNLRNVRLVVEDLPTRLFELQRAIYPQKIEETKNLEETSNDYIYACAKIIKEDLELQVAFDAYAIESPSSFINVFKKLAEAGFISELRNEYSYKDWSSDLALKECAFRILIRENLKSLIKSKAYQNYLFNRGGATCGILKVFEKHISAVADTTIKHIDSFGTELWAEYLNLTLMEELLTPYLARAKSYLAIANDWFLLDTIRGSDYGKWHSIVSQFFTEDLASYHKQLDLGEVNLVSAERFLKEIIAREDETVRYYSLLPKDYSSEAKKTDPPAKKKAQLYSEQLKPNNCLDRSMAIDINAQGGVQIQGFNHIGFKNIQIIGCIDAAILLFKDVEIGSNFWLDTIDVGNLNLNQLIEHEIRSTKEIKSGVTSGARDFLALDTTKIESVYNLMKPKCLKDIGALLPFVITDISHLRLKEKDYYLLGFNKASMEIKLQIIGRLLLIDSSPATQFNPDDYKGKR